MEAHLMSAPLHIDSPRDVAAIREQLRLSRKSIAQSESDAAARVATLNFVVFIDDPAHRDWVLERAARVADKLPSRLIVLDSTSAASGVDVSSSKREGVSGTIITERVDVGVSTIDHQSIISLVQELSVPDIPTVLWWSGSRLLQSRTFSGLAQQAVTVLVDSSGKTSGEEIIRELGEFLTRFPHVVLADLAFMRLAPWQDMIAQFFDDPALREDLFSITALEIESGSDAEALYLAGWLGSRLSWEIAERDAFHDRRGHTIPFKRTDKGDQRRVVSVVLRANETTYCAALSNDAGVVALSVAGAKASPVRYVPLQNIDNTSLIERAILESSRDAIFETSLRTVRELLG
jgi:glucose-6-phosphate dehydrogenase assembly protein OpcA